LHTHHQLMLVVYR